MKHLRHFGGALHVELVAMKFQPLGVVDGLASLNADHYVLRVRVVLAQIVAVVGRHQRNAEFLLQLQQVGLDPLLFRDTLVLDLEIEIPFAEDVTEGNGGIARGFVFPFRQAFCNLALEASGQADQSLGMLSEEPFAHARLVVEAVQRRFGDNLDQVAIAFVILGQHDEMVVGVAFGRRAMVFLLADVKLAAQDRLHPGFLGRIMECHRTEDVAVIGDRDGGHVEFLDPADEALDLAGSVEQGIVGMKMKMDEFRLRHSESCCCLYSMRWMRRLQAEEDVENRGQ